MPDSKRTIWRWVWLVLTVAVVAIIIGVAVKGIYDQEVLNFRARAIDKAVVVKKIFIGSHPKIFGSRPATFRLVLIGADGEGKIRMTEDVPRELFYAAGVGDSIDLADYSIFWKADK